MTKARAVIRMHEMYLHVFVAIYQISSGSQNASLFSASSYWTIVPFL